MTDVIICGGGAAGLSAAIYCARAGLKTLLFCEMPGGQTLSAEKIENYYGFENGISGEELNDIGMSYEILDLEEEEYHGNLIAYDCGLNLFDKRIFLDEWLEDFNEKVSTYQEEDLYILLSTLVSYFYKVEQNKWEGYTIDPFVVSDVIEMILSEIKRREKDFENINVTVQIHSKYYGKARSYEHAINIVKEELGLEPY